MLGKNRGLEADSLKAMSPAVNVLRSHSAQSGVIVSSPHSGRVYPKSFINRSLLSGAELRRNEDAFIDQLFAPAAALGAPVISARFPRCYVDVNRAPDELPPEWRTEERGNREPSSPRAIAGLGVIPTMMNEHTPIYKKPLSPRNVRARLTRLYHPYHEALQDLIAEAAGVFGPVLLLDCHSMPGFAPMGSRRPDIILGDRFGVSCHAETIHAVETAFIKRGYTVARNYPYAGGYITRHYGKPGLGIEALQIEINRDLYLNPITMKKKRGYEVLAENLKGVIGEIIEGHAQDVLMAAQ